MSLGTEPLGTGVLGALPAAGGRTDDVTERTVMLPDGTVVYFDENRDAMLPSGTVVSATDITPAAAGATGKSNPLYGPLGGPLYGAIA